MGEVAIERLAARGTSYSPFVRHVKRNISLLFRLYGAAGALTTRAGANPEESSPATLILLETADTVEGKTLWPKSES